MSENAHVLDLLPAFALGSLDTDEASQVQEHLSSCLICRAESEAFQEISAQMALLAPVADPSPDLKERLMTRVQATRPKPRVQEQAASRPLVERLLPAWGLASLVLILALGAVNLFLWQRLGYQDAFTAPGGMRAVPLSPLDAASNATGFVLVSADGEDGALVVDGLPPLDESQEYQLWLIRDGERTSGAVFSTDENNYGGTRIRAPGSLLEYTSVGITIEPAGGSPQPTGERVLGAPLLLP
ncbi:MAG TPA: anti-sigma factor [Anaerolineales bacterium]|nr:anti-sigma factor [Anaerolineales bacterium]